MKRLILFGILSFAVITVSETAYSQDAVTDNQKCVVSDFDFDACVDFFVQNFAIIAPFNSNIQGSYPVVGKSVPTLDGFAVVKFTRLARDCFRCS
jgi:hypothetical protein